MKVKKKILWITNFVVLSLFSMYTLMGVFSGPNTAYAATLEKDGFYRQGEKGRGKKFMVVDRSEKHAGVEARVKHQQEICTLTDEQVNELDAFFKVDTFDLDVGDTSVEMAAVSGKRLSKHQLMDYLRASNESLDCRLVQQHRVFFLPVIPHIS